MCFEIKIKIHEEADLYNPLDPEGSELSDEVISYMVRKYQEKGRKEKHIIHIISDEPVGSPIVSKPDVLIAMNLPSLDKYEDSVVSGGTIYVDSTLIERKVKRDDVTVKYIPATGMASENDMPTLANMIIVGKVLADQNGFGDSVDATLQKVISAKRADMLETNKKAMKLGADY